MSKTKIFVIILVAVAIAIAMCIVADKAVHTIPFLSNLFESSTVNSVGDPASPKWASNGQVAYTMNPIDAVMYYWLLFWTLVDDYSWQIRTCYSIIVICIFCLIGLFVMFAFQVHARNKQKVDYKKIVDRFKDKFIMVLADPELLTAEQVEMICECKEEEFLKINTSHITRLAIAVREELQEVIYLPNLPMLCRVTGIRRQIEFNLLHLTQEFNMLQTVTILQLPISEGILANYVNHRELDLRNLARMSYILATQVEPYRYLLDFARDTATDEDWAPWYPMALHQLFGWLVSIERPMPNFITLIEETDSGAVAAFFIQEISYWGTIEEQQYIHNYFTSDKYIIRSAAFQCVAVLCDSEQEDKMVESYGIQPERLRREIMNAVYSMKTGKQTKFFEHVYHTSPSKETRELALNCLFDYSTDSRLAFEDLRNEHIDGQRNLFDQIESAHLLAELRRM